MSDHLENLVLENEGLKEEIVTLKQLIIKMEKENSKSWSEIVDEKVETWLCGIIFSLGLGIVPILLVW